MSALLAVLGLSYLSFAAGASIFLAATLYGLGKTFFWPTMLGVVSEQCPKGGALTLNAISGIGMLAVGTLGFPYIGILQTRAQQAAIVENEALQSEVPGLVKDGQVAPITDKTIYEVLSYKTIDDAQLTTLIDDLPESEREAVGKQVAEVRSRSNQRALAAMAFFPGFMLISYLILIAYFRSKGGYKPVDIGGPRHGHEEAADEY
jgi:hypothetical protein